MIVVDILVLVEEVDCLHCNSATKYLLQQNTSYSKYMACLDLTIRDELSRTIKYSRIILFKLSESRISNLILEFKLAS